MLLAIVVSFHPLIWSPERIRLVAAAYRYFPAWSAYASLRPVCVYAIRYHDSRDSGVGSLFVLMVVLGVIALFIGMIGTGVFIRFKPMFTAFTNGQSIILSVLGILRF